MCSPVAGEQQPASAGGGPQQQLRDGLADLAATRAEIVAEVQRAPLRRVDNMITRLYDSTRLLRMHAAVAAAVKREYTRQLAQSVGTLVVGSAGLAGLAGSLLLAGNVALGGPLAALTLLSTAGGGWYVSRSLGLARAHMLDGPGLDDAFRRVHYLQLARRDEFVLNLWERVRPHLASTIRTLGLGAVPFARSSELKALDDILEREVPALRAAASKAGALVAPAPAQQPPTAAGGPGAGEPGGMPGGGGAPSG